MKNNDFILFAKKNNGEINGMTCGWVTDGILWNKNVKMVFVRKSRYTYEFLMDSDHFFTAKFDDEKLLNYFGSVTGRDEDKIKKSGLKIVSENGREKIEGALENIYMRKIAVFDSSKAEFLDEEISKKFREDEDAHVIFVGEIL